MSRVMRERCFMLTSCPWPTRGPGYVYPRRVWTASRTPRRREIVASGAGGTGRAETAGVERISQAGERDALDAPRQRQEREGVAGRAAHRHPVADNPQRIGAVGEAQGERGKVGVREQQHVRQALIPTPAERGEDQYFLRPLCHRRADGEFEICLIFSRPMDLKASACPFELGAHGGGG